MSEPTVHLEVAGRSTWACRYASLCPRATEVCETTRPELQSTLPGRVACHHPLSAADHSDGAHPLEVATHA
jgi:hypothetical protein